LHPEIQMLLLTASELEASACLYCLYRIIGTLAAQALLITGVAG